MMDELMPVGPSLSLAEEKILGPLVVTMIERSANNDSMSGRVISIMRDAFMEAKGEQIYELPHYEAAIALEIMIKTLDDPEICDPNVSFESDENKARHLILRRFCKLSRESRQIPDCFYVHNVTIQQDRVYEMGGFADVYHGVWNDIPVAVKRLRVFRTAKPSDREPIVKAFFREVTVWRTLRPHDHVLRFIGVTPGSPLTDNFGACIISPFMENGNVLHYIDLIRDSKDPNSLPVSGDLQIHVNRWLYEITLGLRHLHQNGIVHGDLRGVNIFVGKNLEARIADFGISVIDNVGVSYTDPQKDGSIGFKAPELLDPLDADEEPQLRRPNTATDIYSFGSLSVQLYTGQAPFGDHLKDIHVHMQVLRGKIPRRPATMGDQLWEVAKECWDRDASKRPDIQSLVERVESVATPPVPE